MHNYGILAIIVFTRQTFIIQRVLVCCIEGSAVAARKRGGESTLTNRRKNIQWIQLQDRRKAVWKNIRKKGWKYATEETKDRGTHGMEEWKERRMEYAHNGIMKELKDWSAHGMEEWPFLTSVHPRFLCTSRLNSLTMSMWNICNISKFGEIPFKQFVV